MRHRPGYLQALHATGLLDLLSAFDPHVAGTPPLGLDLPASDIDILCHAPDAAFFAEIVWKALAGSTAFSLRQWRQHPRAVIASFLAQGWRFELFASPEPVAEQAGWRHFRVEERLLALGGEVFRARVLQQRRAGLKTEPAFAAVLGLDGDPYQALLDLERASDERLMAALDAAGFAAQPSAASSPGSA
ncbi:DUF4269 domain-containing protein [Labrys neptuniae]